MSFYSGFNVYVTSLRSDLGLIMVFQICLPLSFTEDLVDEVKQLQTWW